MTQNSTKQSGKGLEDSFFARQSEELRLRMKEEMDAANKREALATTLEIQSEPLLDNLLAAGIEVETMPALSMIPLVAVGWADETMHSKQQAAILEAAAEQGIREDHTSHFLLLSWLAQKPDTALFGTWLQYVQTLAPTWEEARRAEFIGKMMERSRRVAEAYSGLLGLRKVNKAEAAVLQAIEASVNTSDQ